ncbi:enoyl-CoA hydratase/isomerase family protein [Novosphingobium ginsenosidimutans]|uniref:Enoyl-CoA hydratase/isomerase family protein n=1 Tax=Novosphingobium ginsenosidimutans TaxID=1176536 RepID=A0A5B8S6I7_9SPHN|nr:enoyl-CoA hydratase/isomerase family protein [Novosphingobium ginsenosidimutans]QEA16990.1 enoyl-CoA hydratase/isomerase family protein [Novosphingobium ginsenosidimutans]
MSVSAEDEGLRIEIENGVAALTLDMPSTRNAFGSEVAAEFTQFFKDANTRQDVRSILIRSTGDRDFCLGGAASRKPTAPPRTTLDYRFVSTPHIEMFKAMWELERPVVSQVQGTVAGVGWLLALLADMVVAAKGSRWTHVFVRRGMIPHAGDSFYLPRIIPLHRLNEIALLGDTVTADTLSEWGLINRLVDREQLAETAIDLARRLAEQPTRGLGLAKRHYRRSLEADWSTMLREEMAGQALLTTSADRNEILAASAEGRKPLLTGD